MSHVLAPFWSDPISSTLTSTVSRTSVSSLGFALTPRPTERIVRPSRVGKRAFLLACPRPIHLARHLCSRDGPARPSLTSAVTIRDIVAGRTHSILASAVTCAVGGRGRASLARSSVPFMSESPILVVVRRLLRSNKADGKQWNRRFAFSEMLRQYVKKTECSQQTRLPVLIHVTIVSSRGSAAKDASVGRYARCRAKPASRSPRYVGLRVQAGAHKPPEELST